MAEGRGNTAVAEDVTGASPLTRRVWFLAWPAILTFGLESLVGLVDILMVGRLGAASLAGVGIGSQILHFSHVLIIAVGSGTVALVARFVGAGERADAERVLAQSLYCALVLSFCVAVPVFLFADQAIRILGADAKVVSEGAAYLRYIMMALPMAALFEIFAAGYRGAGDMRTPLVLGAIVNVFNVLANYVLIFGHLGFPALGVRGCGIGTALAFAVGAGLAGVVLRRKKSALRLTGAALRPDGQLTKRVVRIGLPSAVEQLFLQVGFVLYLRTAAHYGTEAIGAYFIGVRILALCFLPGLGFSTAASTIVGQSLGAGAADEAEAGGWEAARLSVSLMSFGGLFIFLGAEFIARAFVNDPAVIGAAVPFIRTLAVAQPLMALDFTLGGSLRGAGDTRFPLWSLIFGFYAIRLGFAYSAAFVLDLGLNWVWLALLGDYLARSLLKAWRFRSGAWRTVQV